MIDEASQDICYKTDNKVYKNSGNPAVLNEITGRNLNVLDVGCGAGDNARHLVNSGHCVDGITVSKTEASICRQFMRNIFVYDLEKGLPGEITEAYDYVICSHVLEHLANPVPLLRDIRTRLKPDGRLVVALPNIMHYKSRFRLLIGRFEYEQSGVWDRTHLRWYTYKTGRLLLEENGYRVCKAWVDGKIPAHSVFKELLNERSRKYLFNQMARISKGLFGEQLMYTSSNNKFG